MAPRKTVVNDGKFTARLIAMAIGSVPSLLGILAVYVSMQNSIAVGQERMEAMTKKVDKLETEISADRAKTYELSADVKVIRYAVERLLKAQEGK